MKTSIHDAWTVLATVTTTHATTFEIPGVMKVHCCNAQTDDGGEIENLQCRHLDLETGDRIAVTVQRTENANTAFEVVGLRPRVVVLEERKDALRDAIKRYLDSRKRIPDEWLQELNELCDN